MELELEHQLILLKWVLKRFGASNMHELLSVNDSEAVNADGSAFKERLMGRLMSGGDDMLAPQTLNDYDTNIIRHTKELNRERKITGETIIRWRYFQYLALLFTELYLDTYFKQRGELLTQLNAEIEAHNAPLERRNRLPALTIDKLNKLAFWMATGSGKTLIFHLHLKQFIYYTTKYGTKGDFKRILLLTPNDTLSAQHIKELTASGIRAVPFQEHGGGDLHTVQVLEITKLKEEQGDKSIAISSLEDKNILFVDEGHKGLGGKVWLDHRQQLCANGFTFEYSATFKQSINAVAAAKTALTQDYATSILFDYSYRHFYNDLYGKDFKAVSLGNTPENTQQYASDLYLTASLLSFYQQVWLYNRHHVALKHFKIERPLWIFVGGSVNVVGADVQNLIRFFKRFVSESGKAQAIENIKTLLTDGLRSSENHDILQGSLQDFANHYAMGELFDRAEELYAEIMRDFFLAPAGGNLYLDNIKGKEAKGEIGLRLGTSDQYFGLINVGDETALLSTLKKDFGDQVQDAEFSDSLFKKLSNDPCCPTSLLIGSRKFTEGWSSWRVSSLGLMGIGQNEGSLIIQLFGRGVRLKGLNTSLRRSAAHEDSAEFKRLNLEEKSALKQLETLNIFALRADYLLTFLSNVGVQPSRRLGLTITQRAPLPSYLKLIGVKQAYRNTDIKKLFAEKLAQGDQPLTLKSFEEIATETQRNLNSHRVVVNRYPRIRLAINQAAAAEGQLNQTHFSPKHLAFLNTQELLFELDQERREKAYLGLHLDLNEERIKRLLLNDTWYVIKIPPELMEHRKYERLELWQEIALELLKKLMKRIYTSAYQKWEAEQARSYEILSADHPNLLQQYELVIEPRKDDQDQQEIKQIFADAEEFVTRYSHSTQPQGPLLDPGSPLTHLTSETHLYNPLIADPRDPDQIEAEEHKVIRVKPTPLNKGELEFVQDLAAYLDTQPQILNGREVYLLRNQSRGRGVSFFEANNFYPDFILWVVEGDEEKTQNILFIDPKGLTHMTSDDPKIQLHINIKEIESELGDPNIHLHSFIISNTPYDNIRISWEDQAIEEINELNVLFQEDQKENYIRLMFERALTP